MFQDTFRLTVEQGVTKVDPCSNKGMNSEFYMYREKKFANLKNIA